MSNAHLAFLLLMLLAAPVLGRLSAERQRRRYYRHMMRHYGHKLLAAPVETRAKVIEPAQY